jgi:hypothetical protein
VRPLGVVLPTGPGLRPPAQRAGARANRVLHTQTLRVRRQRQRSHEKQQRGKRPVHRKGIVKTEQTAGQRRQLLGVKKIYGAEREDAVKQAGGQRRQTLAQQINDRHARAAVSTGNGARSDCAAGGGAAARLAERARRARQRQQRCQRQHAQAGRATGARSAAGRRQHGSCVRGRGRRLGGRGAEQLLCARAWRHTGRDWRARARRLWRASSAAKKRRARRMSCEHVRHERALCISAPRASARVGGARGGGRCSGQRAAGRNFKKTAGRLHC